MEKITFNKVKEAVEAAGVPVNNFNSTGEIATKILNDFEKINKNDFLEALAIVSTVEAREAVKAREEEIIKEEAAKAAEAERNAWRETLLSLNERQKTVAIYIKGVLQYSHDDGIRIIGKAIIDSIVNDDNTYQIVVRLTKALDRSQNLEVSDRQMVEDFLSDIMDIIGKNNEDVIIGKINKAFETYMELSPAEPKF